METPFNITLLKMIYSNDVSHELLLCVVNWWTGGEEGGRQSHLWGRGSVGQRRGKRGLRGRETLWPPARSKRGCRKPLRAQTRSPKVPPAEGTAVCGSPAEPRPEAHSSHPPAARRLWPPSRAAGWATLSTAWLGKSSFYNKQRKEREKSRLLLWSDGEERRAEGVEHLFLSVI